MFLVNLLRNIFMEPCIKIIKLSNLWYLLDYCLLLEYQTFLFKKIEDFTIFFSSKYKFYKNKLLLCTLNIFK